MYHYREAAGGKAPNTVHLRASQQEPLTKEMNE